MRPGVSVCACACMRALARVSVFRVGCPQTGFDSAIFSLSTNHGNIVDKKNFKSFSSRKDLQCVTECICTLCLCCCPLYITLSVSVSSFFLRWLWGRIMTSFICSNSFTYVLRIVILDVSETAREKARGNNNCLSHVPSKRKEEIKSGTSGCSSFVVAYFQPATSIDRLQMYFNFSVNLLILFCLF